MLPVQVAAIGRAFFPLSVDELRLRARAVSDDNANVNLDLPYFAELHNLLSLVVAYTIAALFELTLSLYFPGLLMTSRSSYLALAAIGYSCYHSYRLSAFMSSTRIMLLLTALSSFVVLLVSAVSNPALVVTPFASDALFISFRRLRVQEDAAVRYARVAAMIVRVLLIAGAAAMVTAVIIPARRFSLVDINLRKAMMASLERDADEDEDDEDEEDEEIVQTDVQKTEGGKQEQLADEGLVEKRFKVPVLEKSPPRSVIVRIVIDHIVPIVILFYTCLSSRSTSSSLAGSSPPLSTASAFPAISVDPARASLDINRFIALFAVCFIRLLGLRPRLQGYLNGAVDTVRTYWLGHNSSSSSSSSTVTSRTVVTTIAGTRHYLCMIAFAYLSPIIIVFLLLCIVLVNGNVLPYCTSFCLPMPAPILVTQVLWVLANILVAAYSFFSLLSFAAEAFIQMSDRLQHGQSAQTAASQRKPHVTGSERRKQKRLLQQHKNRRQQQQQQKQS